MLIIEDGSSRGLSSLVQSMSYESHYLILAHIASVYGVIMDIVTWARSLFLRDKFDFTWRYTTTLNFLIFDHFEIGEKSWVWMLSIFLHHTR